MQQVSVQLVPRGYWYYVTGTVPDGTSPAWVDEAIITKYDIQEDPSGRRSAELKMKAEPT